jgi:hypothetical protein
MPIKISVSAADEWAIHKRAVDVYSLNKAISDQSFITIQSLTITKESPNTPKASELRLQLRDTLASIMTSTQARASDWPMLEKP